MTTAYLAPLGFEAQLRAELVGVEAVYDRLFVTSGPPQRSYWSQNIWYEPELLEVSSIKDTVRQLRARQRSWWPFTYHLHRRTELVQSQLPRVAPKTLAFPEPGPTAKLGAYTLIDQHLVLAAADCASPFPNGEVAFHERKVGGPPSRAYLKLWEVLTRLGRMPAPGERCLELGASPGGWTWVIATLGAQVTAYDRAPLDPTVLAMPGVTGVQGDAFQALPARLSAAGPVDWLFSDIICYPERLLEFVQTWLAAGTCRNFVCTLKFQGTEHYGAIDAFAAIPGSQIMHLHHNKHELTWVLLRGP